MNEILPELLRTKPFVEFQIGRNEYYSEYYDEVFIPEEAEMAHPKSAITKRNQWMVENSDLLIAYVKKKTVVHIKHYTTQSRRESNI